MRRQDQWQYREKYHFKIVDNFDESLFAELNQRVYFDDFPSIDMQRVLSDQEKDRERELKARLKERVVLRIAVYCEGALIGWSVGWQDTGNMFYMANSAVLPEHRRQGIYAELLAAVLRITKEEGFQVVHSNHVAANNAVIIPKLKAGFVMTGMEIIEWVGLTVKMAFYHHPVRHDIYRYRVGMAPPTSLIKEMLSSKS